MAGKHISYSEWKNWHICPHYHKLTYIDKVTQFEGNIFTAFGKALHTVCEYTLTSPEEYRKAGAIEALVKEQFLKELKACLLYTSPSPRDRQKSRMPSSA